MSLITFAILVSFAGQALSGFALWRMSRQRDALKFIIMANHKWHLEYDDDGYDGCELFVQNMRALGIVRSYNSKGEKL